MKQFSLSLIVTLVSLVLSGCGQLSRQPEQQDEAQVTEPLLRRSLRDSDEWLLFEARALDETNRIVWETVFGEKITIYAKCRIIPPALEQSDYFSRLGGLMLDQYRGQCLQVVDYFKATQAEQKAKKKKSKKTRRAKK